MSIQSLLVMEIDFLELFSIDNLEKNNLEKK